MDNVIYVDFSRKDQVNELVSRKLDEEKITDADLRRAVLARAETWCSWLTPRIDIKAENIALTLTDLPEDVREAARPEIQQWMAKQLSAWFKVAVKPRYRRHGSHARHDPGRLGPAHHPNRSLGGCGDDDGVVGGYYVDVSAADGLG